MKAFYFLPFFFIVLASCQSTTFSESKMNQDYQARPTSLNQKPYFGLITTGKKFENFMTKNNIQIIQGLQEENMIGKSTFEIDYDKLNHFVTKFYPNPNDTGICYLDLEAPYILPLMDDKEGTPKFNQALQLYINTVKYCKKLRPNVKWGHYGIPFTRWDSAFIEKNEKLSELMQVVDVLFPSLYVFFDDQDVDFSRNYQYLSDNLLAALRYGKMYNKPVIPFVMHRYWSPNDRINLAEMDDKFWERYIKTILSLHVENKYVSGIAWWSGDTYYYTAENGKNVRKGLKLTSEQFMNMNDDRLINKANILLKALKK